MHLLLQNIGVFYFYARQMDEDWKDSLLRFRWREGLQPQKHRQDSEKLPKRERVSDGYVVCSEALQECYGASPCCARILGPAANPGA